MKPLPRYFDGIRVPKYVFFMSLGMLMLLSGVHVGLILLLYRINVDSIVLVHIVLLYWVAVAIGLSLYIQRQMRKFYEEPIQRIARAASQVARGDFSVYLPPVHTPDHLDCLDALTEDFNRMTEALGSIETLKTEFFSNVSHEIKTPIAVVLNTAELLRNENLAPEARQECVETIIHSSKRLSTLITDILKLNKLEKQTISPQPEAYDLCAQLAGCALQFENTWERKGIEFEADLEDAREVRLDAGLMELVWNNLLSNAFKFTEAGGTVTLSERTTEEGVAVCVSDTGCGMDETTCARVFEKFYQGDTSHATEGNGLGLALVRRVLEMMDCQIAVQSAPGRGTAFTVTIPQREGEQYEPN